jgi:hypothetical protein
MEYKLAHIVRGPSGVRVPGITLIRVIGFQEDF